MCHLLIKCSDVPVQFLRQKKRKWLPNSFYRHTMNVDIEGLYNFNLYKFEKNV